MNEDEYIDLDKINVVPSKDEMPGFSKRSDEGKKELRDQKEPRELKEKSKDIKEKPKKKKTTKKVVKKSSKTTKKSVKPKSNNKIFVYLLAGLVLLAIIVILLVSLLKPKPEIKEDKVLMIINGDLLSSEEVQTRSDWLKLVNGVPISDEDVLELSIDIEVLSQEAKNRNITVDDEELEMLLLDMALSAGMTSEELQEYIEGFGINYEMLKIVIKKELAARKLIEQETSLVQITEEELQQYYELNKNMFLHDELAVIRHIQVNFDNKTDNATYQEVEEIKNQILGNRSNFCELVEEYSDDLNTFDVCGEYVLEKQEVYVDELTEKSFELEEDEITIVKTMIGYHVLWKVESIPAGVSTFDEVKEIIRARLTSEMMEETYIDLIETLREEAIIEDYTGTQEVEEKENEVITINLSDLVDDLDLEEIEETEQELQQEEQEQEEITDVELEEDVEEVEEIEEIQEVEETETQITTTQQIQSTETEGTKQLRLAKCLTEKGAKMYNVFWSPDGQRQAEAFGEYFEHIRSVECDLDGVNSKTAECKNVLKKEYPTYPTWLINDDLYEGYQNLNTLASISGCTY